MTHSTTTADLPLGGSAVPGLAPGPHGTITVSMPYYRTPSTVRAAVEAVLAQTYADLLLYVVNDGDHSTPPWAELDGIVDDRLIRVDLPQNRGRYFADAVVLGACDTPWFAIHDTDDRAAPDWLETLVNAAVGRGWLAAFAPQWVLGPDGTLTVEPVNEPVEAVPGRMRHLAHHAAVYRTAAVRAAGGPHPRYRIGYDTALVNMISLNGPIGAVDRPLYTRQIRPESLTTATLTRRGGPHRRQVRKELELMLSRARSSGAGWTVREDIGVELLAEVEAMAAAVRTGDTVPPVLPPDVGVGGILAEDVWTGWALDRHTAEELSAYLHTAGPRRIVETGSGMSTVLLAEYAARTGARVVSLEHSEEHAARTRSQLMTRGLADRVELMVRPVTELTTAAGVLPWYSVELSGPVDFALIDGPPGKIGRAGALFGLWDRLPPDGWQVWLDDADRTPERAALLMWAANLPVSVDLLPTPKGLGRVFPGDPAPARIDASDVAVTLLTGGRPDLLSATVSSLLLHAPGLLETAHVAVLHNGWDSPTEELISSWGWVDHSTVLRDRLSVGDAASALLSFPPPRQYSLHLEDDWQLATASPGWLDAARNLLTAEPQIAQVRLRHRGDAVRREHLITRRPIWWKPGPDGADVAPAHYTLNPSLMRSEQVPELWPAPDERGAARTFYSRGWLAAQLRPGVFRHIGGGASLRLGQR